MSSVPGAFELDDDEIGLPVNTQEVNPALAVTPTVKFFGNYQRIRRDHIDLHLQQLLKMFSLPEPRICEIRGFNFSKRCFCYFVDCHSSDFSEFRSREASDRRIMPLSRNCPVLNQIGNFQSMNAWAHS